MPWGAELITHDTITVKSQGGDCKIELCFGDITKLKKKDKVDVIFVSSFGNNYDKMPGTVIGAVHENLGIDVKELSHDKEEDLRSLYSCWWSKPLPSKMPYNRLLCFESRRNRAGRPQELVGHAFRCLVPILKNKDASVITPLLSTGNQGYDAKVMLEGMIHASISWVKAGLPIRLLKIVVYATIKNGKATFKRETDSEVIGKFAELKTRYESANLIPQEVTLEYDVYLSFSDKDQKIADMVQARLVEEKPDIRIFTARQKVDTEVFYQDQMYDQVSKSARVITGHEWQRTLYHSIDGSSCMIALISPSYLKSSVCREEYSLAQTKHLSSDSLHLIPVCICDGIEADFTKESHIPMLDARPGVYDKAVNSICSAVVTWLETSSFAHLDQLLKKNPDNQVNVPDLMEKLRAARFMAQNGRTLRTVKTYPPTFERLTDAEQSDEKTAEDETKEKQGGDDNEMKEGSKKEGSEDKGDQDIAEEKKDTEKKEDKSDGQVGDNKEEVEDQKVEKKEGATEEGGEEKKVSNEDSAEKTDDTSVAKLTHTLGASPLKSVKSANIVFSYHQTDVKFVYFLKELISTYAPHLIIKSEFKTDQARLDSLEDADHIIALLSPNYIESPQHVEEFHMGLWRQRVSPEEAPLLVPVQVALLPKRPTYFQLVGYPVNIWDALWADLLGVQQVRSPAEIDKIRHAIGKRKLPEISPDELLPLTEAAQVVMSSIKTKRSIVVEDPPLVRPALVNTVKLQKELTLLNGESATSLDKCLVDVPLPAGGASSDKPCAIM